MIKRRVLITTVLLVVLVFVFYLISSNISKYTGLSVLVEIFDDEKRIINCLEKKDLEVYINSASSSETLKEMDVYDYLTQVDVFNCLINKQHCLDKGINSFPTWIIEGEKIEGEIDVSKLSELTNCK